MRPIPLGARGTFTLRVTPAHLANQFKDAMLPPVFATPMMILAMENAALNAIRGYLDLGESAVGTAVDVRRLAATPMSAWWSTCAASMKGCPAKANPKRKTARA